MPYLGQPLENDIQVNRYQYTVGTATDLYDGSTTIFPCVYSGSVEVSVMGIELAKEDIIAISGTHVEIVTPLSVGQIVQIKGFYKVLDNTAETQTFDPTGSPLVATTTRNAIMEVAQKGSARNTILSTVAAGVLAQAITPTTSFATKDYTGNGTAQNIVTGLKSYDPNWVSGRAYSLLNEQDAYCIHNYYIYKLLADVTSATTPDADPTKWEVVPDGVSVPWFNSQVWIKSRSNAFNNNIFDSLRGKLKTIYSNTTGIEVLDTNNLTSFNVDGFSIGADAGVNTNLSTFVAWQEQFDTMVSGTTNQGKRYITASNAQSGKFMGIMVGSGTAGHQIPHGVGTKPDFMVFKNRDAILDWPTYNSHSGAGELQKLNTSDASSTSALTVWNSTEPTDTIFTLGTSSTVNALDQNLVFYGSSNRDNHTITTRYQGTGAAGNVVDLGLDMTQAGAKVMIKSLTTTENWVIKDNVRGSNPVSQTIIANSSEAETLTGTVEFHNGYVIPVSSGTAGYKINEAGVTYLIEATVPNYDKPNGGLNRPAGNILSYAEGVDGTTGDLDSIETTTSVDFSLTAGTKNYLFADKGNTVVASIYPMIKQIGQTLDANSYIYDVGTGTVLDTAGVPSARIPLGEVVVDALGEAILDTLVVYPKTNDFVDVEVHGDAKFYGGFDLGQTLVNETANRLAGVPYKNETGKPKQVYISVRARASAAIDYAYINDEIVCNIRNENTAIGNDLTWTLTVPSGDTYKTSPTANILYWKETE